MSENPPNPSPASRLASLSLSVNIPPRPALLMALQHEMLKEDLNTKKIAQLIRRDVAMAATLLESTNSAFFNLKRRATTVEDVISLIGMGQCSAIMTGFIVKRSFGVGSKMMARFWDVSEKRAKGMSYLARETHYVSPEVAYSFGLFCDIGIPLLKATFPAYLQTLSTANSKAGRQFLAAEDIKHGVNHAFVGALLAEKWSISPDVVLAISMHHDHEVLQDESVGIATRALVALNHVVEKAIQEYRGEAESLEWIEGGAAASEALGISPADVDDMCEALKGRFRGSFD